MTESDASLIAALEQNAWSMFSILGTGTGGVISDTPTRLVIQTPVPQPPYNAVWRFCDEGDRPLGAQVDELLALFAEQGTSPAWVVHPTTPPAVRSELTARGWTCAEELYGMAGGLDQLPQTPSAPPEVTVREAVAEDAAVWIDLVSWRYGIGEESSPYLREVYDNAIGVHTRLWVASVDGDPVSKVGLHLQDGVAGIYGVATREHGRGRGLARLLTLEALHAARDAGAELTVLHSTPMARSLYRKLGYRDVVPFEIWALPGTLHL